MRSAFEGLRLPVVKGIHHGDQIWVRLRVQGSHSGAFVLFKDGAMDQVVPPTGRAIDFEQIQRCARTMYSGNGMLIERARQPGTA